MDAPRRSLSPRPECQPSTSIVCRRGLSFCCSAQRILSVPTMQVSLLLINRLSFSWCCSGYMRAYEHSIPCSATAPSPTLRHRDKRLFMECGDGVVELVEGPILVAAVLARFPAIQTGAPLGTGKLARPLDGAGDVLRGCCRELDEFTSRAFEREAMFVFTARRIWPQRGNADAVLAFDRLRVPSAGRAVDFRRHPALNVPAIYRGILRFPSQLNALSQQSTLLVAVLEFSTDPREAVPAPHGAIVCFAEPIDAASARQTMRHGFRRVVRFTDYENHFPRGLKSRDLTTNLCSPQSSIRSVTLAS